jgi:hypothetical protein
VEGLLPPSDNSIAVGNNNNTNTNTNNNNNNNNNISKSLRKYVSSIPGNHEVRELQKIAILGTAHILRKVLT